MFDIAELREVTSYDELELDTLGDQKTALFLIMSDTDDSFNFLISMCYTQLFNLLCEKADPLELAEIKRRWEPYINQLPDYEYLCKDLLNGKM